MDMKHVEIKNARLVRLIERVEKDKGTVLLRDGDPVAAILPYDVARCALAISERLKGRKEPFTQQALDDWVDRNLAGLDMGEFMQNEL